MDSFALTNKKQRIARKLLNFLASIFGTYEIFCHNNLNDIVSIVVTYTVPTCTVSEAPNLYLIIRYVKEVSKEN